MPKLLLASIVASHLLIATQFSNVYAAEDSAQDPWYVLQKAAQAARQLSYKGCFTYQSGVSAAKALEITHMNFGQGEYSHTIVLDGLPREVLSQGSSVVIFSPQNEKVVIEKRRGQNMFPALLPANLDIIKSNYQAKFGGSERIGGHDSQIVLLEPRDKFRYSYKLWIDRQYGLLLKSASANDRNEPMEQIAFNQVALLNTQNMDWFQPNVDHSKSYVMEEQAVTSASNDITSWTLTQLPSGYRKIDQVKRMVPGKSVPVNQVIYSDGLASVSLFIEPLAKDAAPKMGHTSMGATNFYADVVEGYQIMVVGEVPEVTVAQIAGSVSFKH